MSLWDVFRGWFRPEPVPTLPVPGPAPGDWMTELLLAHNRERLRYGITPLVASAALDVAAIRQAAWMQSRGRLTHAGKGGNDVGERVSDTGYVWRDVGENIAAGQATVAAVMSDWLASPGHRADILSGKFRNVGFGRAGGYWCVVFAG